MACILRHMKLRILTRKMQHSINMKATRILLLFFLVIACNKENDDYKSVGTITGADYRMCACCGGWFINIDDAVYLFDTLPKDSNIDLATEKFPVTVRLDWKLISNSCSGFNRITVLRIRKI
jgi:hypothetical protein